jgi:VWFA-related protein
LEPAQPPQQQQQQPQPQGGGGYPQGGGYPGGGGGRRYPQTNRSHGGTKLYDAILLASEDLMSKQQGRKALVLLTDGIDSGSKVTLFESIRAAQKADTLVYSVYFADNDAYSNPGYGNRGMGRRMPMPPPSGGQDGPDGKKILQQIAEETGGRFNSVGALHHLDKIFADIQEELRSQYNIGYTPDPPSESGLFRHIHLTAKTNKKKDLVVQARAGYYSR